MTREERQSKLNAFITCLKCEVSGKSCDDNCPIQYEAGNMGEIIENLEAISKELEREPCEDCISRQAALSDDGLSEFHYYEDYVKMRNYLKSLPSVRPQEPKTGIWKEDIDNNRRWDRVRFYCSQCGDWQTYGKPKFCPNCGCRMESEE